MVYTINHLYRYTMTEPLAKSRRNENNTKAVNHSTRMPPPQAAGCLNVCQPGITQTKLTIYNYSNTRKLPSLLPVGTVVFCRNPITRKFGCILGALYMQLWLLVMASCGFIFLLQFLTAQITRVSPSCDCCRVDFSF